MNFSDRYKQVVETARTMVKPAFDLSDKMMREVAENAPSGLRERITQTVSRPGKRLRSILLFMLAQSSGKNLDLKRVAQAAASVEMLHLASLVHDDVIDKSEVRRGASSLYSAFGNKIAVLAGDYMLAQSLIFVINEEDRRIPHSLANAASSLVAGEIQEIDLAGNTDISFEQYIQVIEGKTASLLESCGKSGAILAGYPDDIVENCGKLGLHFGIAFQIIDDILDYGIGAENLGKKRFGDLQNGLITLPLLLYFKKHDKSEILNLINQYKQSADNDEAAFNSKEGEGPDLNSLNCIVQKLESSGSFDEAKAIACDYLLKAANVLDMLPESDINTLLKEFFISMTERTN